MTKPVSRRRLDKQALNSLTELYYAFVDLVEHMQTSPESKEELDMFYLRDITNGGGLRGAIIAAYEASNLDPKKAGFPGEPLTLERLLPLKTISSYVSQNESNEIRFLCGELKHYNNAEKGHLGGMDDVTIGVVDKAKAILRKRRLRETSGTEDTMVDIRAVKVAHKNHRLNIGHVRIKLQPNSIMDLASDYMTNEVRKGEQADSRIVAQWVTNHNQFIGDPTDSHGIKDALRDVNDLINERTETSDILFNTGPRNGIVRNF
jgi:hypothetical protein